MDTEERAREEFNAAIHLIGNTDVHGKLYSLDDVLFFKLTTPNANAIRECVKVLTNTDESKTPEERTKVAHKVTEWSNGTMPSVAPAVITRAKRLDKLIAKRGDVAHGRKIDVRMTKEDAVADFNDYVALIKSLRESLELDDVSLRETKARRRSSPPPTPISTSTHATQSRPPKSID